MGILGVESATVSIDGPRDRPPVPRKRRPTAKSAGGADLVYDLWHLAFANLVERRGPPDVDVLTEVRLTIEPQRADMLLLRRRGRARADRRARVLRGLWRWLGRVTILEYKSPVGSSFRPGDLLRLFGYGVLYDTAHLADLPRRADLTLALVLPAVTPTLQAEIARMGWKLVPLGGGYARIEGAEYAIVVAAIDEVSETEKDEFLALFSRRQARQGEATRWLSQWMTEATMKRHRRANGLPGYDEMFQKLAEAVPVEKRLAGLTPEQRLAGLDPEQRLAGLDVAHAVLALPPELLRAISGEYLRTLPADVQREVQKRLRRRPRPAGAAADRRSGGPVIPSGSAVAPSPTRRRPARARPRAAGAGG